MAADANDSPPPDWKPFEGGRTVGLHGTEGGVILRDEEHGAGARITLERGGLAAPFAVTCGAYGLFMHTAFAEDEAEGWRKYEAMRGGLVEIVSLPDPEEVPARVRAFVGAF